MVKEDGNETMKSCQVINDDEVVNPTEHNGANKCYLLRTMVEL